MATPCFTAVSASNTSAGSSEHTVTRKGKVVGAAGRVVRVEIGLLD